MSMSDEGRRGKLVSMGMLVVCGGGRERNVKVGREEGKLLSVSSAPSQSSVLTAQQEQQSVILLCCHCQLPLLSPEFLEEAMETAETWSHERWCADVLPSTVVLCSGNGTWKLKLGARSSELGSCRRHHLPGTYLTLPSCR